MIILLCYVVWSMYSAIRINDRVFKQSSALLRAQMQLKDTQMRVLAFNETEMIHRTETIELVIQMLQNDDDIAPATILGWKANFALVGTFISVMVSGIVQVFQSVAALSSRA
jgi:hypothetical protein